MTLFLTLVLAALGLTGTLAAFGGETWRKEDAPLLHRITRRGWLALTCLLLAFVVGAIKEVRAFRIASESQANSVKQQAELSARLGEIRDLQKRLSESAEAEKQASSRYAKAQLGAVADEAMLLAAYTRERNPESWLGGKGAYEGAVRKSIDRVDYALENLQRSPIVAGALSKRFLRVAPWAVSGLKKSSTDPVAARDRLNHYVCGLLASTGEMLVSIDRPEISTTCGDAKLSSPTCTAELASELAKHTRDSQSYADLCPRGSSKPEDTPAA